MEIQKKKKIKEKKNAFNEAFDDKDYLPYFG